MGHFLLYYTSRSPEEQTVLEFLIPDDLDTFIDLDINYIRGKLISVDGKNLDNEDFTAENNTTHSIQST